MATMLSSCVGARQSSKSTAFQSSLSSSSARQRQSTSVCPHPTGSQAASHFRGRAARVSASEALDRAQDQSVTQSNPPHLNGSLTRNGAARSPAGTGEPAETPRTTNGASVSGPSTSPVMAMAPLTSGGIAKESPPQRASSLTRPGIAAAAKTESSAGRIEVESQTGSKAKRETSQSQSPKAPRGVRSSSSFVVGQAPETPPSIFEYFQSSATLDPDDDGPPRFFCPLDGKPREDASQEVLPRLFFLPGIEGTGFGLALHHKSLARLFEVSCLNVPVKDRTPFSELVEIVEGALREEHSSAPERALFLMGESFGAVLALAVAERTLDLPITLILVNPATSFPRSPFQPILPLLSNVPDFAYPALPFVLSFSLGNPVRMASTGLPIGAGPLETAEGIRTNLIDMMPTLPEVAKVLPKATLAWKLQLLDESTKLVDPLLSKITCRTLILASGEDNLIPSKEEAQRLKKEMAQAKVTVRNFNDSGHTLLLEGGLDVASIIKGAGVYRRSSSPRENPTIDAFPSPTVEDVARGRTGVNSVLRRLSSPVFFSTLEDGRVVQGFSGVPTDHRPILFVGNHQTYAPDLPILVGEFLRETGVLMRGLAHPMAMGMFGGDTADTGASDTFRLFGAVPVTAANTYKLLANGEAVLLFPGGAREALKNRGEEYKLFWPEREEFIRMAIKFKATIIPFAAVGVDDSYNYVLDGKEQLANPLLAPRIKEFLDRVPRVRDESAGDASEQFVAPVVTPKQVNRLYFLFKKPIRTTELGFALKDRSVTGGLYRHVKKEVQDGIEYLLEKREQDPYKDTPTRLIYEASWDGRQAPTFAP